MSYTMLKDIWYKNISSQNSNSDFWFPGRWIGGVSAVLAPVLFLTGMLLRVQFHFFFPQQLEAFRDHPVLMTTAYNFFVVGNLLLWPAVITLATMIGKKRRALALWGGTFVMLGLFARAFQAGISHLAFQLVEIQGLDEATKTVANSYGAYNFISSFNGTIMFGWFLLAIGSYLSGTLGLFRSIALGLMGALMVGVLKGTSLYSIIAATGLCFAFIPFGFKVLMDGPKPKLQAVVTWTMIVIGSICVLYFFGQAG